MTAPTWTVDVMMDPFDCDASKIPPGKAWQWVPKEDYEAFKMNGWRYVPLQRAGVNHSEHCQIEGEACAYISGMVLVERDRDAVVSEHVAAIKAAEQNVLDWIKKTGGEVKITTSGEKTERTLLQVGDPSKVLEDIEASKQALIEEEQDDGQEAADGN